MENKMTGWRKKQIAEAVASDVDVTGWTYKWNDNVVSFEEYKKLEADHAAWVKELEQKELEESKPVKTKKGKK